MFYLRLGNLSVTEYKFKLRRLYLNAALRYIIFLCVCVCYNRLRPDFKIELFLHVMKSVTETFLLALELELSTFKISERCLHVRDMSKRCSTCEGYGHYTYECPSIKCYKCGEFEHCDYQYPSESQHTLIMCKLMTLIIQDLSRMSILLLRLLVMLTS